MALGSWPNWAWILLAVCCSGCEKQAATESKYAVTPPPKQLPSTSVENGAEADPIPVAVLSGKQPWIEKSRLPWDSWYLQYLDGKRIGYSHVVVSQSADDNQSDRIRIDRTDCIEMLVAGVKSRFVRELESIEFSDGRLIAVTDIAQTADGRTETDGKLLQGTLNLTTTSGDDTKYASEKWEDGVWGLMGIQAILMQNPPQPGQQLKGKVFVPQLGRIANVELVAGQPDITALPGGKTDSLLPIDVVLWTEDSGMRSRNWINERGEVIKTISLSGANMSTFWSSEETAQRTKDEFELDDLISHTALLKGASRVPIDSRQATYAVDRNAGTSSGDLFSLLAKTEFQTVKSISALSAEVNVISPQTQSSELELATTPLPPPDDSCLAASPQVPSEHPAILQIAEKLKGEAVDPTQVALRLSSELHKAIALAPLVREVNDVLSVARAKKGTCVEQAMLLTTLLRSQNIPARVASGLAIEPNQTNQAPFHMWTEAWIENRWVPLDATQGTYAGVNRIKLLDNPLAGENPYAAILPVFRQIQGFEIVVKDSK